MIASGRIQETIHFSPGDPVALTYALVCDSSVTVAQARYTGCEMILIVPQDQALRWARTDEVGIYATIDLGLRGTLNLTVEKDFACLDLRGADNADTYPNPKVADSDELGPPLSG